MEPMTPEEEARVELLVQSAVACVSGAPAPSLARRTARVLMGSAPNDSVCHASTPTVNRKIRAAI